MSHAVSASSEDEQVISVEGLAFQQVVSKNRRSADSSCKIMFQYMSRTAPLQIQTIIQSTQ